MNLSEKRQDAANTLVVSYNATPEMVNNAYVNRLTQRFHLQNIDIDSYNRGNEQLYDARIRMSIPADKQWRAQLRLMATTQIDKMTDILMVMMSMIRRDSKSVMSQILIDDLMVEIPKMRRKYNAFRGICAYEIGGIWGMFIYHHTRTAHDPIVALMVYGSMFAGAITMGMLRNSLRRSSIKIAAWSKLLSYDNIFSKEK